jgi:hypothetical protein
MFINVTATNVSVRPHKPHLLRINLIIREALATPQQPWVVTAITRLNLARGPAPDHDGPASATPMSTGTEVGARARPGGYRITVFLARPPLPAKVVRYRRGELRHYVTS